MSRHCWLRPAVAATVAIAAFSATTLASGAPTPRHVHSSKLIATLAGTWSGQYSGAFSGTFTLHWTQTGSALHGTIALSNPKGTYGVTGSVEGGAISFGAVGAGATYTGSVSGKSMSGSYESPKGGGSWSATES